MKEFAPMILIEIEEDVMEKCFADIPVENKGPNGVKGCDILTVKNCKDCKFFKTRKQVEESKKKSMDRINKSDIHTKSNIINLYFEGTCFIGDEAIV